MVLVIVDGDVIVLVVGDRPRRARELQRPLRDARDCAAWLLFMRMCQVPTGQIASSRTRLRRRAFDDSTLALHATSRVIVRVCLKGTELLDCLLSRPPLLAQPFDVAALEAVVIPHAARR